MLLDIENMRLTREESNRVNILKLIFVTFVIFIHVYTEVVHYQDYDLQLHPPSWLVLMEYALSRVISRCAVPGFFFLSAVLLYQKKFDWWGNIKKKTKTLVIPYIIITTLWLIALRLVNVIDFFKSFIHENSVYYISQFSFLKLFNYYFGLQAPEHLPLVYPLWFMRDLFVINVFAVIIKRAIDIHPVCTIILIILPVLLGIEEIGFLSAQGLLCFCLGYYFVKYQCRLSMLDILPISIILTFYLLSIFLDCSFRGEELQRFARAFSILCGLVFFTRISGVIEKTHSRLVLRLSKYAFPIYLLHEPILTFSRKLCVILLPQTVAIQVLEYFFTPLAVVAICVLFSRLIDSLFPVLSNALFGGRTLK